MALLGSKAAPAATVDGLSSRRHLSNLNYCTLRTRLDIRPSQGAIPSAKRERGQNQPASGHVFLNMHGYSNATLSGGIRVIRDKSASKRRFALFFFFVIPPQAIDKLSMGRC